MHKISRIHIAYGSESGNAEALAGKLARQSFLQSYHPGISTLNEVPLADLEQDSLLLVLTSSFGDGEAPANAENFVKTLEKSTALLCRYCVFALGDVSYDNFCGYGKNLDHALRNKGARALIERVDADLNHAEIFGQWLPLLQQSLSELPERPLSHRLSVRVYGENTAYAAQVSEVRHLAQSTPPVYHLRLSLKDSGIYYQAGDLLYVREKQPESLLEQYAAWFNAQSAVDILREKELRLLNKNLLRDLAKISGSAELKALIKISNKKALERYLYGHDLLDVLRDFDAGKKITLNDLAGILPNLAARAYSVASCGKTHPDYADLCVRHVRYQLDGRDYRGTASDCLAHAQTGQKIAVFVKANPTFRLPEPLSAPVVMIGSGTGIAPYIGFLQYLDGRKTKVKSYLFFGERHRTKDFLYRAELEDYLERGVLTALFTAFSRDQAEKYYVQNALADQAELIWRLIEQGAYFYICGSKSMSKAVDEVLHKIAAEIGHRPYVDAFDNIVAQLVAQERLRRDVY